MNIQSFANLWYPAFVNFCLQSTILLGAAFVVLMLSRRASASYRHLIATLSLTTLLLLPLLPPIFPAGWFHINMPAELHETIALTQPATPQYTSRAASVSSTDSAPTTNSQHLSEMTISPAARRSELPLSQPRPNEIPNSIPTVLFYLWLIGVSILTLKQLIALCRLASLANRNQPAVPDNIDNIVADVRREATFYDSIRIIIPPNEKTFATPVIWGISRANLLIPPDALNWSETRLHAVLLHELAHILRKDWLKYTAAQFICCLFWFNPLVWLMLNVMEREAECACDDFALGSGVSAPDYASHLLDVAREIQMKKRFSHAAIGMARSSSVDGRLKSILARSQNRRAVGETTAFFLTALFCAAAFCIVSLRPLAAQNTGSKPTSQAQPTVSGTPATSSGKIVQLADGLSVELVAIGTNWDTEDWWSPDGTPLIEAPTDRWAGFHRFGSGPGGNGRVFYIRLNTQHAMNTSTSGIVLDKTNHVLFEDDLVNNVKVSETHTNPARVDVKLHQPIEQCTYRFGIAVGDWETVSITKINLIQGGADHFPVNIDMDDKPFIRYSDAHNKSHFVSLLKDHAPLGKVARRILAFDTEGIEIPLSDSDSGEQIGVNIQLGRSAIKRIAELRLQTRPYQWMEFKDIPMNPMSAPRKKYTTMPETRTGFKQTFSCGISIEIKAMTERKSDGGHWWQPDGTPLGGAIKEYSRTVFFNPKYPTTLHERMILTRIMHSRPVDYEMTGILTPATNSNHDYEPYNGSGNSGSGTDFSGYFANYSDQVKECSLKVGISSGKWETVSALPMPAGIKHVDMTAPSMMEKNEYNGDLNIVLSKTPYIDYESLTGSMKKISFPLHGMSIKEYGRRVIGLDRKGKIVPLQSALGGNGSPMFPLTYRDQGTLHRYNPDIDLASIKEFRLQIRPFEWREFKHIVLNPKP